MSDSKAMRPGGPKSRTKTSMSNSLSTETSRQLSNKDGEGISVSYTPSPLASLIVAGLASRPMGRVGAASARRPRRWLRRGHGADDPLPNLLMLLARVAARRVLTVDRVAVVVVPVPG